MKQDKYHIESSTSLLKYDFYSEGPKGKIKKQIAFKAFREQPNVFNLGFGDVDKDGEINDTVISDNRDSRKVLATVALTIYKFYENHPGCYVFITGSTKTRTRLYRMAIANNLEEIRKDFDVYGAIEGRWLELEKGIDYEAFMIIKKEK